jgi:hypothetical protein
MLIGLSAERGSEGKPRHGVVSSSGYRHLPQRPHPARSVVLRFDGAGDEDFALVAAALPSGGGSSLLRRGISVSSISTRPASGERFGSTIAWRSWAPTACHGDPQMIDTSIVRLHQHRPGPKGESRRRFMSGPPGSRWCWPTRPTYQAAITGVGQGPAGSITRQRGRSRSMRLQTRRWRGTTLASGLSRHSYTRSQPASCRFPFSVRRTR